MIIGFVSSISNCKRPLNPNSQSGKVFDNIFIPKLNVITRFTILSSLLYNKLYKTSSLFIVSNYNHYSLKFY
jgi:hypothetical protein